MFGVFTMSCSGDTSNSTIRDEQKHSLEKQVATKADTAEDAEKWLRDGITSYFDQELNDMNTLTTPTYAEYKHDLMASVYEGGLSYEELQAKWGKKFSFTKDDVVSGFLIGAQDYYNIEIEKCFLLSSTDNFTYKFKVTLHDTGYNERWKSEITVIPYKDSFRISYIKDLYK